MKLWKLTIGFLILFSTLFTDITLAALKIESQIEDTVLSAGDSTTIQVKIDGAKSGVKLDLPQVDGLIFKQSGAPIVSSQTTIVNGKIEQFSGLVFQISVQTTRVGSFSIAPIRIHFKNTQYQTRSFSLKVSSSGETSKMKLELTASKKDIYPSEPVLITLKWYIQDNIAEYEFDFPLLQQKDLINLNLSDKFLNNSNIKLTVNQYEIPFIQTSETENDEVYTVYSTQFVVYPSQIGDFSVPAASVKAFVKIGTEVKRDFFGRRVRVPKHKQSFTMSNSLKVKVKSLPIANKPKYFTGAIGKYKITISSNAQRVKVGDPVEIQIAISGSGKLERIEVPLLSEMPGYLKDFVIVDSLQPGDISDNKIVFKQVIRPKHHQIKEIPPVWFSYFNTETEAYETIKSNALPLKVLPSKMVKDSDIIDYKKSAKMDQTGLSFSTQGIQSNYLFEDALENQREQMWWLLFLMVPPLLYFGLFWFSKQKQFLSENQALLRSKTARTIKNKRLKQAKKQIKADQQEFLQALSITVSGYISDKLDLGNAELTIMEIQSLVKKNNLDRTVFDEVVSLLEDMDRYRYTGIELPQEKRQVLYEKTSQALKQMQKIL